MSNMFQIFCHLYTNRQDLHDLLKFTNQFSQFVNYGQIETTCFFFQITANSTNQ